MAVLIDENTKVICQDLTGSQDTFHAAKNTANPLVGIRELSGEV